MARPALVSIIGIALIAAVASASGIFAPGWPPSTEQLAAIAHRLAADLTTWAHAGYLRRPAVMIGLAGLLALPVIALSGLVAYRLSAARTKAPAAPAPRGQDLPRTAWLGIVGADAKQIEICRELIQIGRENDNDICLADSTVHRYHAVIERSPDQGFVITDVSGPKGNGVRINGVRTARATLADGDVVELGRARLAFATAA